MRGGSRRRAGCHRTADRSVIDRADYRDAGEQEQRPERGLAKVQEHAAWPSHCAHDDARRGAAAFPRGGGTRNGAGSSRASPTAAGRPGHRPPPSTSLRLRAQHQPVGRDVQGGAIDHQRDRPVARRAQDAFRRGGQIRRRIALDPETHEPPSTAWLTRPLPARPGRRCPACGRGATNACAARRRG